MANHLTLGKALLEIGEHGSLSIFSNGKSLILSKIALQQMVRWLDQEPREKQLIVNEIRFELNVLGGLRISTKNTSLSLAQGDEKKMARWLKQY